MKFAHIRVSEYFTFAEQIFHSRAISLARRANFVEKSTCFCKCFFLAPPVGLELNFTSSLRLSCTNCFAILPCRASAQIVALPQFQQREPKENPRHRLGLSFVVTGQNYNSVKNAEIDALLY